jgi:putative alpha-1,2-mannosidase
MSPADVTTNDHRYLGSDGQIYKADGWRYFSSWSIWDTFRINSLCLLLQTYINAGYMPLITITISHRQKKWSTVSESTPTVRTEHASILLLDAYRKGIRDLDFAIGYEGMKKEADELPMASPDQSWNRHTIFGHYPKLQV